MKPQPLLRSMSSSWLHSIITLLLIVTMMHSYVFAAGQLALPPDDIDAPVITHEPMTKVFEPGLLRPITATVVDNVGVKSVLLFYRQSGSERYNRAVMQRQGESDIYSVTLEPEYYAEPGFEYYIQATDNAENRLLYGYAFSPIKYQVETEQKETTAALLAEKQAPENSVVTDGGVSTGDSASGYKKWLWIGLGVLAVGALAGGSGGGGGDDPDPPPTKPGTIQITGPSP